MCPSGRFAGQNLFVEVQLVFFTIALLPGALAWLIRSNLSLFLLAFPAVLVAHGLREIQISRLNGCGTGQYMGSNFVVYGSLGALGVLLVTAWRYFRTRQVEIEQGTGLTGICDR